MDVKAFREMANQAYQAHQNRDLHLTPQAAASGAAGAGESYQLELGVRKNFQSYAPEVLKHFGQAVRQEYGQDFFKRLPQEFRDQLDPDTAKKEGRTVVYNRSARRVIEVKVGAFIDQETKRSAGQQAQAPAQPVASPAQAEPAAARAPDAASAAPASSGVFGLKNLQRSQEVWQRPQAGKLGEAASAGMHLVLGPAGDEKFKIVGTKPKGVEPGFVANKIWTKKDDHNLTAPQSMHKYALIAHSQVIGNPQWLPDKVLLERVLSMDALPLPEAMSREQLQACAQDKAVNPQAQELMTTLRSWLASGAIQPGQRAELVRPEMQKLNQPNGIGKEMHDALVDYLQKTEAKFQRAHYVKLDYTEQLAIAGKMKGTYTVAARTDSLLNKIKSPFHRLIRSAKPREHNANAVKEVLANDLMRSYGVHTQKLKIIRSQYGPSDPTPKLLLDGTHMSGPLPGVPYNDLEDYVGGRAPHMVLVKTTPGAKDKPVRLTNSHGHQEADTSIEKLGRNKIFLMLLADRDAVGSKGQNKGRIGNLFAAIDPGKSLDIPGMNRRDLHNDFSQDKRFIGDAVNFSLFDQSSYSERMEGVKQLADMRDQGDHLALFEAYKAQFNHQNPELDFSREIDAMRAAYQGRMNYILDTVFKDRLAVYEFKLEESAKAQALDVVDALEKITSRHTWVQDGVALKFPTVKRKDRNEWTVEEKGDDLVYRCESSHAQGIYEALDKFRANRTRPGSYNLTHGKGYVQLRIPKNSIAQAHKDFGVESLRTYDREVLKRSDAYALELADPVPSGGEVPDLRSLNPAEQSARLKAMNTQDTLRLGMQLGHMTSSTKGRATSQLIYDELMAKVSEHAKLLLELSNVQHDRREALFGRNRLVTAAEMQLSLPDQPGVLLNLSPESLESSDPAKLRQQLEQFKTKAQEHFLQSNKSEPVYTTLLHHEHWVTIAAHRESGQVKYALIDTMPTRSKFSEFTQIASSQLDGIDLTTYTKDFNQDAAPNGCGPLNQMALDSLLKACTSDVNSGFQGLDNFKQEWDQLSETELAGRVQDWRTRLLLEPLLSDDGMQTGTV